MFNARLRFPRRSGLNTSAAPSAPFGPPRFTAGKAPALPLGPAIGDSFVFEEAEYRAWNPDVDAAIRAGTLPSGRVHFENFGRRERRAPYLAAPDRREAARLQAGDELLQIVRPERNWWAAAAFVVRTHGGLARIVFDCEVRSAANPEPLRCVHFDEWATDGEELVLKFPPITDAAGTAYSVLVRVNEVTSKHTVQFMCEPAQASDGLKWNQREPAAVRIAFELRYTPVTLPGPSGITLNPVTHCAGECIHCLSRSLRQTPSCLKPEWLADLRTHFRDGPGVAWCVDYATDFFKAARSRPELIDLLVANGNTAINTEGHYVTESALRKLFSGKVRSIGFSVDAATEQTYAVIRRGLGKLQAVLEAAALAVRVRRELGLTGQPCIALSMVVMKSNIHEVVALVDVAAKAGVDAVW